MYMTKYHSDFLRTLHERGFIHQLTDAEGLDRQLASERVSAYIGFDCTAPSLHVGSLIQIMILRHLQKCGHKPIVLLGGGTTKVGDPSGKDEARKMLTDEDIARNTASIQALLSQFIRFGSGPSDAILVNNAEWLDGLNYIAFLRDYGRHFSVNRMLTQDSVKLRLEREQNLSFLEFNYMLLQAYDFVELNRRYGCTLQIGGSDQWGNIVMGIDLQRRMSAASRFQPLSLDKAMGAKVLEVQPMINSRQESEKAFTPSHFLGQLHEDGGKDAYGLTTPLLATAAGAKMGKTADGAVWLSADYLSPYEYWQFWRNVEDADVGRFLKLFTDLPMDEVKRLGALKGAELNDAKKVLATEATRIAHGDRAARSAAETARKTFEEGITPAELPEVKLKAEEIGRGVTAYELFRLSGLSDSGGEAKRLIRGGGAKINDRKVMDENELIGAAVFAQGAVKLTAGKKRHLLVRVE